MKLLLFICGICCWVTTFLSAQERRELIYEFNNFHLDPVKIDNQEFYSIQLRDDCSKSSSLGQALLPCYNQILSWYGNSLIGIEATAIEKDTIHIEDNKLIVPLQKSLLKIDTHQNLYFDKAYYSTDKFQGEETASIQYIGKRGKENIAVLKIAPLRYNPVKNIIERIKKIKVIVSFNIPYQKISAMVHKSNISRPYKMIILTDNKFKESLMPFVNWKIMQGFDILQLTTSEIGNNKDTIRFYLQQLYKNSTKLHPAFDYLLIVGDTQIIPTFEGKYKIANYPIHYTDLYYAEYTNDILPDVFYGRISASDTQTLNNIIEKTIIYEQCNIYDKTYLQNSLLVAGKELGDNAPTFTNGQINYTKQYLCSLTDTNIFYNPYCAEPINYKLIKDKLNIGNSWINYSGHGSSLGWQSPPFRLQDIDTVLTNKEKYGVFINNCCHAGKYDDSVCFTEYLLQAKNKGAVSAIGSSDYTLWDEDYYWSVGSEKVTLYPKYNGKNLGMYDRFFHTHSESLSNHYTTMGQIIQAGCLAVTQSLSNYSSHYWEMYNLQGDPTLMPYVGMPQNIPNNIPKSLPLGTTDWELKTIPYAYVALSYDNKLIDAKQSDSLGNVVLNLSSITETKTINIVITHQFYKPLIDSIQIFTPNEALIMLKDITIFDKNTGDTLDHLFEQGEYIVGFDIVNVGKQNLETTSNYIELSSQNNLVISQNSLSFSKVNSKESQHIHSAFEFKVKSGVMNLDIAHLNFTVYQSQKKINEQKISKEIFAPAISIYSTAMQVHNDTITLTVQVKNEGQKPSSIGNIILDNLCNGISVKNSIIPVKSLQKNESEKIIFQIKKTNPDLKNINFTITLVAEEYKTKKDYNIPLEEQKESFEEGFGVFNWQNIQDNAWVIDSTIYYKGSMSARSKPNLADNSKSRLSLIVNNDVSATISFYAKVSCEQDYDKFIFYIDDEPKTTLSFGYDFSGNEEPWHKYTFTIPDGQHILCFSYEKDQSNSYGKDAAWIDDFVMSMGTDTIIFSLQDITKDNILLFPNPANDYIYLNNLPNLSDVMIIDNNRKVLYFQEKAQTNSKINISLLQSGMFYVIIRNSGKIISQKKLIVTK